MDGWMDGWIERPTLSMQWADIGTDIYIHIVRECRTKADIDRYADDDEDDVGCGLGTTTTRSDGGSIYQCRAKNRFSASNYRNSVCFPIFSALGHSLNNSFWR